MAATLQQRLTDLREHIDTAARHAGRAGSEVRLIAVAKTRSAEEVCAAIDAGVTDVGENYVDEALVKIAAVGTSGRRALWHFIGQLQSNKSAKVARAFDWVHTVDRPRIAERLAAQRGSDLPPLEVTLQVNFAGETSKAGVHDEAQLEDLARCVLESKQLRLRGLMTIPDPGRAPRAEFDRVREALQRLRSALGNHYDAGLDTLSMGMSDDFVDAIAAGSTMVRIGTALFGPRPLATPATEHLA